jgi:hypothetical protein
MEASRSLCATREQVGHVLGRGIRVPCLLLLLASAVLSNVSLAADLRVTAQESTIFDTTFASGSVVRLAASTNATTFTNCIFDGAGTQLLVEPRTRNFHGAFSMQLKLCEFRNGAQLLVEDAGVISIGKYLHGIELDRTSFSSGSSFRLANTTFVYTASTSSTYMLRVATTPFPTLGAGAQITITGNAIERPCCGSLYFVNLNSFVGWDANASVVISRNEVTVSLDGYSGFLVEAQGGSGPAAPGLPITIDSNRVGFYDLASLGSDSSPIYAVRNATVSVVGNTGVRNIVRLCLAADSSAIVEDHADSSDSAGTRIHLQNGRILSLRNVTTRGTLALNNVPLQSMDPIALVAQLRAVRCLQYSFAAFTSVSWVLNNDVVESFQFLSCTFDGTTIRLKPTSAVQSSSWFMIGFDKCTFARGAIRMNGENVTASGSNSPILRITGGTLGPQTDVELVGNEMAGFIPAGLYVNGAESLADTRIVVANNTFTTVQSAIIMTVDLSSVRTALGTLIVCERNTVRGPVAAGSFSLIKSSYRLSNCTLLVRENDLTAAGTDSTDAYNSVSLWLDNSSSIDLSGNRDRGSRWWTIDGGNVTSLDGLNVTTLALARLPRAPLDLLLTVAFTVSMAFFDQLFLTEDIIIFGRYSNLTSRLHFERCYFRTGFVFAASNLGSAFAPTLFVTGSVFEPGLKLLAVSNRDAVLKGRPAISIEASQIHRGAMIQVADNTLFAADTGATAVLSLTRCTLHGGTVVQVSDNRITFLKSSSLSSVIVIADPTKMPDANVTVRIERNEVLGPSTTAAVFLASIGSISASERVSNYARISLMNNSGTNARLRIAVTSGSEVDIQNLTLSGTSLTAHDHGRVQITGGVLAAMRNVSCMGLEFDTPSSLDRAWSLIPGVSNATSVAFTNTIFPNNTVWRFAPLAPGRLRQLTFTYCTVGVNTTMDVSVPNVTLLGAPFAYFYHVQFSATSLLAFRESSVLSSGSGGDAAVALAYCTLDSGARVAVSGNNFTVQSTDWEATLLSMRYNTALAGTCFTVENNTLYGNGGALVTLERQNYFPQANATLVVAMNYVMGSATILSSAYVAVVGYYKSGHFVSYEPVSGLTTILTRNVASPGQVVVRMRSSADLYLTSNRFSGGAYSHGVVAINGGSIRSLFNHSCQSLGISEPATPLWIDALLRIAAVELVSVSYATVPAGAVWRLWPQKYAPQATSYSLTYMTFGTECTVFAQKALVNGTGNTPFLTVAYSTFEAGSTVSVQSSTFVATKASHGLLSLYGCTLKARASIEFSGNRMSSAPRSLSGIAWVQAEYTMFAGASRLAVRDCAFDTEANDKNSLLAFAGTNFFNDTTGTARIDFARNVFATADSVVRVGDASGAAPLKQFVFTIVDNVWRASGRATAAHTINVHATSSVWLDGNKDDTLSTDWNFQNSAPASMSGLVARFVSCNNLTPGAEVRPEFPDADAIIAAERVQPKNADLFVRPKMAQAFFRRPLLAASALNDTTLSPGAVLPRQYIGFTPGVTVADVRGDSPFSFDVDASTLYIRAAVVPLPADVNSNPAQWCDDAPGRAIVQLRINRATGLVTLDGNSTPSVAAATASLSTYSVLCLALEGSRYYAGSEWHTAPTYRQLTTPGLLAVDLATTTTYESRPSFVDMSVAGPTDISAVLIVARANSTSDALDFADDLMSAAFANSGTAKLAALNYDADTIVEGELYAIAVRPLVLEQPRQGAVRRLLEKLTELAVARALGGTADRVLATAAVDENGGLIQWVDDATQVRASDGLMDTQITRSITSRPILPANPAATPIPQQNTDSIDKSNGNIVTVRGYIHIVDSYNIFWTFFLLMLFPLSVAVIVRHCLRTVCASTEAALRHDDVLDAAREAHSMGGGIPLSPSRSSRAAASL